MGSETGGVFGSFRLRPGDLLGHRRDQGLRPRDPRAFGVPQEKQERLANVYEIENGKLNKAEYCNLGIQNKMTLKPSFESGEMSKSSFESSTSSP